MRFLAAFIALSGMAFGQATVRVNNNSKAVIDPPPEQFKLGIGLGMTSAPTFRQTILSGSDAIKSTLRMVDANSSIFTELEHRVGGDTPLSMSDAYNTDIVLSANAYANTTGVGGGVLRYDETKPGMFMQWENNWPNQLATAAGDVATQTNSWVIVVPSAFWPQIPQDAGYNWVCYWKLTDAAGTRTIDVYKNSDGAVGNRIATGSRAGNGSITLAQANSSGVTGSVVVAYTADDTTVSANILTLQRQNEFWFSAIQGNGTQKRAFQVNQRTDDVRQGALTYALPTYYTVSPGTEIEADFAGLVLYMENAAAGYPARMKIENTRTGNNTAGLMLKGPTQKWALETDAYSSGQSNFSIWDVTTNTRLLMATPNGVVIKRLLDSGGAGAQPNATLEVAGSISTAVAGNPATLENGELWYDTTANLLKARIGGVTTTLGAGSSPGGANTELQFNNSSAFGGDPGLTYIAGTDTLTVPRILATGDLLLGSSGANTIYFGINGLTPWAISGSGHLYSPVNATYDLGAVGLAVRNGYFEGQIFNAIPTGTAPFVVASTTNVANLNASSLNGATITGGGTIALGGFTLTAPGAGGTLVTTGTLAAGGLPGAFTTLSASGQVIAKVGTIGSPSIVFTGDLTTGFFNTVASNLGIVSGGNKVGSFGPGGFRLLNTLSYGFSSDPGIVSADTVLSAEAAATLQMGADAGTPVNQTLKAHDWTSGGTGVGAAQTVKGGNGTATVGGAIVLNGGTATAGGTIVFQTAVTGTLVDVGKFDNSTTAGDTRFFLYDVDNATLERVTVGATDSGGAGFKVLRIPN